MRRSLFDIEVRDLRYFIAAADAGSFRKAAAALGVQESSVSRRIRDVESQIGASLFVRHSGGINLTMAGQRFLHRACLALDHIRDGAAEVAAIGRSEVGHLSVGLFSSLASGFVSKLFAAYDNKYPNVEVKFSEGSAARHLLSIDRSHIDLAFTIGNRQPNPYDAHQLWRENVFAALWDGHPLSARSELSWSDLAHESFLVCSGGPGDEVRDYLNLRLCPMGSRPRFLIQSIERYSLLTLVALRRGVAPMLESETAVSIPGVVYRPIAGERLPFFAIASPRNDNPAARTLLSLARTMAHPSAPFGTTPASDLDGSNAAPLRMRDPSP